MEVTKTLAQYLVSSRWEDIPERVRHEASRALLNWLGCAVGSCRHETVERALGGVMPFSGPPQAVVLGRTERLDIVNAALVNGISSHVLDFDDTHARAIHPSAPVLPALLACAEWRKLTGADFMHAFVLAVEAEERVGLSVFPEHYERGWHITGTAGVFGAAAGVGKLLGLDELKMTWALGIAATQAAGLQAMFGSDCKSLHPGAAARNGLTAALLAASGFTSSERAIEAPRGFAHVVSPRFDPAVIAGGLGSRYELLSNMYKPYACGLVVHAAIDGCIGLTREHSIAPESVEAVELTVGPLVGRLTAIREPRTGLEGKFSVYHAAAAAIVHGAAGEAQFSDACVLDPRVVAVRGRVTTREDPAIGRTEARVTIRTRGGRSFERHVEHALGTLARPMSDADLEAKFRGLAGAMLPAAAIAECIELCWTMATQEDAGALAHAAVPHMEPPMNADERR
jgi:2-methylcitrate dehydratase PrpD